MVDLTAVSLFAGVGGFDLAMERAGIEVVATVEIDKAARGVLARRWPDRAHFGDITEVRGDDLRGAGFVPYRGVLTGGFPCQDLSVAGRRAGLRGGRSGLFWEIARLADELRPRWLVLENVPGLLSSNGGRDMGTVLGALADLGYGWAYRVLDAQYFGLAQRRKRVFIVGCLGDDGRAPGEVLALREGVRGDSAPGREAREEPARALRESTGGRGVQNDVTLVAHTLTSGAEGRAGRRQEDDYNIVAHTLRSGGTGGVPSSRGENITPFVKVRRAQTDQDDETWDSRDVSPTLNVMDNTGDTRATVVVPTLLTMREGKDGGGKGPLVSEDQSLTLATGNGQTLIDGMAVRRLTPVECERLQGFPDGWTAGQKDGPRYRQMGNAVAVTVVEWIMGRLVRVEEELCLT